MPKMKKWKLILAWCLLPVLVAASVAIVEAVCNRDTLILPASDQQIVAIDPATVTVAATDPAAEFGPEDPAEGMVDLSDPSFEATIPFTGYVSVLRLSGSFTQDTTLQLSAELSNGEAWSAEVACGSYVAFRELPVHQSVTGLKLRSSAGGVMLSGIEARSVPVLNAYRMLLTALCALAVGLLLLLANVIGKKPEVGFLIVALCAGIMLCVLMPTCSGVSYDDQIHFDKAWTMSTGLSDVNNTAVAQMVDTPFILSSIQCAADQQAYYDIQDGAAADIISDDAAVMTPHQWALTDAGYVTQAFGLWLSRTLGMPFHVQVMAGRLFNLLGYVALCYLAIRALKRFKLIFSAVALMPTAVFLASNYSYDPTCMGLCMLGLALAVNAMLEPEKPLSWQRGLVMLICFVLAGMIKAVYLPMMLVLLMLPRAKFADHRSHVVFKMLTVVLFLAAMASILVSLSGDVSSMSDSRGDGADAAEQLAFILSNPFTYAGYFFAAIWNNFSLYFIESCRLPYAYLGTISGVWAALSLALVIFAFLADQDADQPQRFTLWQRAGTLVICLMTIGLTFTALYLGFSAVGSNSFSGVQGRYLLPVMPLLLMLLSPDFIRNKLPKRLYMPLYFLLTGLVLAAACIQLVYLPRCA